MRPLRILIADDHEMLRRGVRAVLAERPCWQICGEASNGREAVELACQLQPDVIVMDLTMPVLNGLEATRQIRRTVPRARVLVLSFEESEELIRDVLAAGAAGYLLKSDVSAALLQAVESVGDRRPYFTSKVAGILLAQCQEQSAGSAETNRDRDALSPREREVLQQVAEGKSTKEVAAALNISVKTAENHRTHIMRKLGLHSVADLVRYAIRNKIAAA